MEKPEFLALEALLVRYQNLFLEDTPPFPDVHFDTDWTSPCVIEEGTQKGHFYWKPIRRESMLDFSGLERALGFEFPELIKDFYGSYWSNGICVERVDINCSLIQIWNEEDEELFKENLLGHLFAKIKNKLPITYFLGCTYSDEVICLEHETGKIMLEKPGFKPHKELANSLSEFLISLNPTKDNYTA